MPWYSGLIMGVFGVAAAYANAHNEPVLASFFSNPESAKEASDAIAALIIMLAGGLPGANKR